MSQTIIGVTGATGKLGAHVVEQLLAKVPAETIVAIVRDPAKAKAFADKGVQVRRGDFDDPGSLPAAFKGIDRLLLISANAIGERSRQHANALEAARTAGVKFIAYTSIPKADSSRLVLATEHRATEEGIRKSGIPFAFLRNGWYTENYTESLGGALAHNAIAGASGDGKVSAAPRSDFAAAAVAVLTTSGHEGKVYELGGDAAFTRADLAREVSRLSGKDIAYQNLPVAEFEKMLAGFGLPPVFAHALADSEEGAARGDLLVTSGDLSKLIGRPTVPLATTLTEALRGLGALK